jgi:hypothetical protein
MSELAVKRELVSAEKVLEQAFAAESVHTDSKECSNMGALGFVREVGFDVKIESLAKTYARMHDFDEAVERALMRTPEHCVNVGDDYYVWKTEELVGGIPPLRILYRYNRAEHRVTLLAASEVSANDVE